MNYIRALLLAAGLGAVNNCVVEAQSYSIYSFTTIAGGGNSHPGSADGTNTAALFNGPNGIAIDARGNLYIGDTNNNTIRMLTPVGTNWVSSTLAGLAGAPGSADGTNSAARFDLPCGVALDSSSNIYVADTAYATIRKVTPVETNWVVSTIAGTAAERGRADGTNDSTLFEFPVAITVDANTNVYIADMFGQAIRRIVPIGTNWVGRSPHYSIRNLDPEGVAVDGAGNVYWADFWRIFLMTPAGTNWPINALCGQEGNLGSTDGTNSDALFNQPHGIVVDGSGNLFIADTFNDTIRKVSRAGTNWVVTTIGGLPGKRGGADGINNAARFDHPYGLAMDSAGNLYVADSWNNTIRQGIPLAAASLLPVFQSVTQSNGLVTLIWSATPGLSYQVQYSTDLTQTNWSTLGVPMLATNSALTAIDGIGADPQRFYRVALLP